jgi:putative transposon-encoded protein
LFHFSRVITHILCALGVLVKIKGEANCSWNETRTVQVNRKYVTETTTYKDHDLYFENHVTLFGGSGKKTYVHTSTININIVGVCKEN